MREKNQKDSRKRLNALILLVAFTAILLIVSTYAWFSTQRNVTLTGLKGKVNVAEGLQISLDGSHFVNSIDFDDFDQSDIDNWTVKPTASTTYLDDGKTFQSPAENVTNVVPGEYLPVSGTGDQDEGIGTTGLSLYKGTYTTSEGLSGKAVAPEEKASGYFAFDLYLMNTSATGVLSDKLQLDATSSIVAGDSSKGIQNSVRIGFALYENSGAEVSTDKTLSGAQIIEGTSTGKNIKNVAIWEPNAEKHVDRIVESTRIRFSDTDKGNYTLGTAYNDEKNQYASNAIVDNAVLPTYALTATTPARIGASFGQNVVRSENTTTITYGSAVYNWSEVTDSKLKLQKTTQTQSTFGTEDGVQDSIDLKSVKDDAAITMVPNQYQKLRVYVWIEGQDPDCVNYASLGKSLTLDLGLSKPESTTTVTPGP